MGVPPNTPFRRSRNATVFGNEENGRQVLVPRIPPSLPRPSSPSQPSTRRFQSYYTLHKKPYASSVQCTAIEFKESLPFLPPVLVSSHGSCLQPAASPLPILALLSPLDVASSVDRLISPSAEEILRGDTVIAAAIRLRHHIDVRCTYNL